MSSENSKPKVSMLEKVNLNPRHSSVLGASTGDEWMKSVRYSVDSSDPRKMINACFSNFLDLYELRRCIDKQYEPDSIYEGKDTEDSVEKCSVFSVWRPTKMAAMKIMMRGRGVGKGLDIKGKSAKKGILAGYVPFVQIHNDDQHKKEVGTPCVQHEISLFFPSRHVRNQVRENLQPIMKEMQDTVYESKRSLKLNETSMSDDERENHLQLLTVWQMKADARILDIDFIESDKWGLEIPERLFWEAFVKRGNCTREPGSGLETGRDSEPDFFLMNLHATRNTVDIIRDDKKVEEPKNGDESVTSSSRCKAKPKAVVWQMNGTNPMDPMSLVVAYEEEMERVKTVNPVVSDFDPFLFGTKGVEFNKPIPKDQIKVLSWCIGEIEELLKKRCSKHWTRQWLEVLKRSNFHPKVPEFGFGDPVSYEMIEYAVHNLVDMSNGPVRHGPECFNYYFPQPIDNYFLVISAEHFGKDVPYKYMNEEELRQFLLAQVKLGYTFPLNPSWILTLNGWRGVWRALCLSNHPNVQQSLNSWYPEEIRDLLDKLCRKYEPIPHVYEDQQASDECKFVRNVDLAMLELRRHIILKRAKSKLKAMMLFKKCTTSARSSRSDISKDEPKVQNESYMPISKIKIIGFGILILFLSILIMNSRFQENVEQIPGEEAFDESKNLREEHFDLALLLHL